MDAIYDHPVFNPKHVSQTHVHNFFVPNYADFPEPEQGEYGKDVANITLKFGLKWLTNLIVLTN